MSDDLVGKHPTHSSIDEAKSPNPNHHADKDMEAVAHSEKHCEAAKCYCREAGRLLQSALRGINAERVTAFAAVAATMLAAAALYIANEQLVSDNRAWVAPQAIFLTKPNDQPGPILQRGRNSIVSVKLENTGNEPARSINPDIKVRTVTPQQYLDTAFMIQMFNDAMGGANCKRVRPDERGTTLFPGSANAFAIAKDVTAEMVGEIIDGEKFLVMFGCVAYRAIDKNRRTGFCRFFDSKRARSPENWPPSICPGDYAD